MTVDQWLSATLDVISLLGFVVVIIQLHDSNRQTKLESQIRLYDINRELVAMGFSKPELFEILADAKNADPTIERRYLQLWLNQLCLINSFIRAGNFTKEDRESFGVDLRDMLTMENMQRQWQTFEKYYPASFRKSVNDLLHNAGRKRTKRKASAPTS